MLPHLRGGPCAGVRSSCSVSVPTRASHRRWFGRCPIHGRALPRSGVSWFLRFVGKKTPRYLLSSYATAPLGTGVVSPCGPGRSAKATPTLHFLSRSCPVKRSKPNGPVLICHL